MDVQDDAGLRADQVTAAVPPVASGPPAGRPGGSPAGQGRLFMDAHQTYADTDELPAVPRWTPRPPGRAHRWLRVAVVAVALAVLVSAGALGLVKSGVLKTGSSGTTTSVAGGHPTAPTPTTPVAMETSTGSSTATYTVGYPIYSVTVSTTTGRSWVSVAALGQKPQFAGIVAPASSQKVILLGPSTVEVGAGGTTVTVAIGARTATLTPPSAPFTYQFVVASRS